MALQKDELAGTRRFAGEDVRLTAATPLRQALPTRIALRRRSLSAISLRRACGTGTVGAALKNQRIAWAWRICITPDSFLSRPAHNSVRCNTAACAAIPEKSVEMVPSGPVDQFRQFGHRVSWRRSAAPVGRGDNQRVDIGGFEKSGVVIESPIRPRASTPRGMELKEKSRSSHPADRPRP